MLIVDDEENVRLVLSTMLSQHGFTTAEAASGPEAIAFLRQRPSMFMLADVRMPGMTGMELCRQVRAMGIDTTVIMMSAYGNVDLALEAIQAGAYDYVSKPFRKDEVLFALAKAEERCTLRNENQHLREALQGDASQFGIVGKSEAMQRCFRLVRKVAGHKTTVLIQGESGTGKELFARAIHDESPRAPAPFVAVNCGAIPEALLESELFGHVRGAFTDANRDREGLFTRASGGTLFLDEIGELPKGVQVKLLRALQEGAVRPVGSPHTHMVDVRVVAATMRNLKEEVVAGRFREDLFYRLNVLRLDVPPLRSRKEDLPLLVAHFLNKGNLRLGMAIKGVEREANKRLLAHDWPGNVRELENALERAMVLSEGELLGVDDLPEGLLEGRDFHAVTHGGNDLSIKRAARYVEETLIRQALQATGGNRTAASKLLEISHRALLYKIKEYNISE